MTQTLWRNTRKYLRLLLPFPSRKTLRRWFPKFEERNIAFIFARHGIDTILDVGAHTGQFVTKMRSSRFKGRIISFEPVSRFHGVLLEKSRRDPLWDIAPPMALGATPGELEIKVMDTHSSFRTMIDSLDFSCELVKIQTLDNIFSSLNISPSSRVALKLDVQGFEKEVLEGAVRTMGHVQALLIELSLKPVYEGETYFLEMLSYLRELGFHVVYFSPVVSRAKLGEMWQVDALLVRKDVD